MTPFFSILAASGVNVVIASNPSGGSDSAAIQAKIDEVGEGGIVFFNPGTYNIDQTIFVNNNGTKLISSGMAIFKASSDAISAGLLLIHGCYNVTISGIQFDGDKAIRSYSGYPNGINITNASFVWIENCKIKDTIGTNILASQVPVTGSTGDMVDKYGLISDIYLNNNECNTAGNGSIIIMGGTNIHVTGNKCYDPYREGIQAIDGADDVFIAHNTVRTINTACIALEDHGERTGGDPIRNINIHHNILHAESDYCVYIDHRNTVMEYVDISYNKMHSHQGACIGLDNDGFVFRDFIISNNKLYAQSDDSSKGIEFTYSGTNGIIENMDISNNEFRNCSIAFEKKLSNLSNVSYTNNKHYNCNSGVDVEKLDNSIFSNNTFREHRGDVIKINAGGEICVGIHIESNNIKYKALGATGTNVISLTETSGSLNGYVISGNIINKNGETINTINDNGSGSEKTVDRNLIIA